MSDLSFLKNKHIVILGAGVTGLSCARFLAQHNIAFAINDSRNLSVETLNATLNNALASEQLSLGQWDKTLIESAELLLVSPGIDIATPAIADAIHQNTIVLGDVELFCQLRKVPTIAVTGSNGKSTVVSLLAFLGNKLGFNAQLGGNIGIPVLDNIDAKIDFLILELSSFQLETLSSMTALSASILNVCDDHLDRHKTLANYQAIKQKIYPQCQVAVINRDDERTWLTSSKQLDKLVISFGQSEPENGHFGLAHVEQKLMLMFGQQALIAVDELPISGIHNAMNCLAALALGYVAGWSLDKMVAALPEFSGLAHRCQTVVSNDGIHWVNDSKATNVGATIAAINGFAVNKREEQIYLIAGGDAKGADVSELALPIEQHIAHMFTYGKDGEQLAKLSDKTSAVINLQDAVKKARQKATKGDVVLLSPACASLDMFKNYMERGLAFEKAVQEVQS